MSPERILQVAIAAGVALTLFVLERFRPLRRLERPLGPRLLVNGAMSVLTYGAAFAVVQPVAMGMLEWTSEQSFGILALVAPSPSVVPAKAVHQRRVAGGTVEAPCLLRNGSACFRVSRSRAGSPIAAAGSARSPSRA